MVGAGLGAVGVITSSFVLLLIGMTLFGISNTSNLLARYAAADVTRAAHRGRAMGLIVWGSTLGSILGPNLMTPVVSIGALIGLSPVGSAFLISIGSYALAAVLVQLRCGPIRFGSPRSSRSARRRNGRPGRRVRCARSWPSRACASRSAR